MPCTSPSPAPQYDSSGRRTNTRYHRCRERLEVERHSLTQQASRTIPNYRPPAGYSGQKMCQAIKAKVYIPAKDFPEVNVIGQILGPRGRSLVAMNTESGANIVLRGRGSVKEGSSKRLLRASSSNPDTHHHDRNRLLAAEDDEPLHCLITADAQDKVDKARALIQAVIDTAITTPEHANERKRGQLRDLAVVNGTFRDDEGRRNDASGLASRWETPPGLLGVVCYACSGSGHIARDCPDRRAGGVPRSTATTTTPPWRKTGRGRGTAESDALNDMYAQFLAEI
ncbi:putative splicing factor [Lasiosphaeria ovina]|uniref:Branchpoint-bridging protein n=1 Tax=Lasiosphaeria ovina TaxID=92902 RepID=A0AAE0NCT9_9PEZI|nr:putative splicing factor [Lasiosphaeria ovina]